MSDIDHNNKVGRISLKDVTTALHGSNGAAVNVPVTEVSVLVRLNLKGISDRV
jgi:hypothetical protein